MENYMNITFICRVTKTNRAITNYMSGKAIMMQALTNRRE